MASAWVDFRDWFVIKILPMAVGILASVIKEQAAKVPGLNQLIGLIQPFIQSAYEKAVREQDLKMQAILLAVLSKLFLMELVLPGVEVLSPEDAESTLMGMAKDAMDVMPEHKRTWWEKWWAQTPPEPPGPPSDIQSP